MNVLTDSNKEVPLPPPVKLSASAARRRRRRRRPRSNSALLAALPLDQREMFRNLWRATLQAFVGSQSILGDGEPSSPNVSMRDDAQARNRDVVKVRNVLIEADADADHVTRGRRNILDSEGLNSTLRKDDLDSPKKRDKKCKKRSRRSRSCSTDSSSSDSNSEYSDHSTDRGARKKSHRHKKKKKEKRKAKKRSRDSKDDSVETERRRAKRERHKRKKDSSSRKSRRDLPRNSEKNVQKSKLSFSPYADEDEDTKERDIEKGPGTQLCLKLPAKKLNGPVWVGGSSEEEKSCSPRDGLSLNRKDRNGNSVKQPSQHQLNGLNDASSKDSSSEFHTSRIVSEKRKSIEILQKKGSDNDLMSPALAEDAPTQRKSSSSPDCAKIRRLLANRRTPPQESAATNGKATSAINGSRDHSVESLPKDTSSRDDMSKWEKADDLPVAYRSRSASRSGSSSRSRSRSVSRRSRSTSRRSDSRKRSSSRSTYSSRSRSKSFSSRSSRSRSYSRSHSRHRSLSIPRRSGSPSFLDKRRITSARKRPVPYNRYRNRSLSPESSDDDAKS